MNSGGEFTDSDPGKLIIPEPPDPGAPVLAHALHLAGAGLPVIFTHAPTESGCTCGRSDCTAIGKHPIDHRWQKSGTTDPTVLQDRLSRLKFTPNVSIVLGLLPSGHNVVAIDVDDSARIAALIHEHGLLPTTARVDSARGYRLLYTLPAGTPLARVGNIAGIGKLPGVDLKTTGGQIVMPPSLHASGIRYTWHTTGAVAELPAAWVLAILKPPPMLREASDYTPQLLREDRRMRNRFDKYLQAAVLKEATLVSRCGKGLRNSTFYSSLCSLLPLAHGLSLVDGHGYVIRELSKAALACGLSPREIAASVASAEGWLQESGAIRVPHEVFVNGSKFSNSGVNGSTFSNSGASAIAGHFPDSSPSNLSPDPEISLIQDNNQPAKCAENVARLLAMHPDWKGGASWSEYSGLFLWPKPLPEPIRDLHRFERETVKADYAVVQAWCMGQGLKVGTDIVELGVKLAASRHPIDELGDWLRQLPAWDGVPRLDTWLSTYLGCEDSPYHRVTGSSWLRAAVQRGLTPGLPVDIVPILQGEQGTYKNRSLEILFEGGHKAAPWLSPLGTWDPDKPETKRLACQRWILHDDEFSARKPRIVDAMKSWVSRTTEQWQAKYENDITTAPRRALLICSTNVDHYLHDRTGNRRWYPWKLAVTHPVCHDALAQDRLQLFAEAMRGPPWREGLETVSQAHEDATEEALGRDALEDLLGVLIEDGRWAGWTRATHLSNLLGVPPERQTVEWVTNLGSTIKRMGGGSRRVRIKGTDNKIRELCPPGTP